MVITEIRFRHFDNVDESALTLDECKKLINKRLSFMDKFIRSEEPVKVKVKMLQRISDNLTDQDNEYKFSVECVLKTGEVKRFEFKDKGLTNIINRSKPVIKENILQAMNKNQKKISIKRAEHRKAKKAALDSQSVTED